MGNVIGIVAEYNPFHNGHARLIEQTRARLGADCPVVCVMSGDFVQRGSPAVYAKFARAEAAARCGADLVLELPLPWALSSAEGFARGAVGLLGSLGVVTHLSFGSECGELEPLQRVAEALLDPLLGEDLRAELQAGIPFAAARQQAVARRVGALAELLQAPNNILAVEYLKAIFDQRLDLRPLTILRTGAQHDRPAEGNVRSASELRTRIGAGENVSAFLPRAAAEISAREKTLGRGPVLPEALESAILSRLRMLPQTAYNALPGASEGLGNGLYRAAHEEPTLDGVLAAAKSKRYAHPAHDDVRGPRRHRRHGRRHAAVCACTGHRRAGQGTAARDRYVRVGAGHHEAGRRTQPAGRSRRNICPDGGCARSLRARLPRQRGATLRRRLAREPVRAVTGRVRKVFEILM